jgi:hypothetical protein
VFSFKCVLGFQSAIHNLQKEGCHVIFTELAFSQLSIFSQNAVFSYGARVKFIKPLCWKDKLYLVLSYLMTYLKNPTIPLTICILFFFLFLFYYSYVHTRLGSFLPPATICILMPVSIAIYDEKNSPHQKSAQWSCVPAYWWAKPLLEIDPRGPNLTLPKWHLFLFSLMDSRNELHVGNFYYDFIKVSFFFFFF